MPPFPLLGGTTDTDCHIELALPEWVNGERVTASLRDGVLEVRAARRHPSAARRIPVRGSG